MLFKKITLYHLIPALIAAILIAAFISKYPTPAPELNFSAKKTGNLHHIDGFKPYELESQIAFSIALKRSIPVLLGSSELTSNHLKGLAHNFFNGNTNGDRLLSLGHAGFQCFGILTALAANKELLPESKLTIILSPGWFEEQYCNGTSIKSFFEYATPNYLYQIQKDSSLDNETRRHILKYINRNFDKITCPDATLRLMGKKQATFFNDLANFPFKQFNEYELKIKSEKDLYIISQKLILESLRNSPTVPFKFTNRYVNWDSLKLAAKQEFESISNNNSYAVENGYYDAWLKNKPKKNVVAVVKEKNQEVKDIQALIHFLNKANCKPLFVIMPLNPKAHKNLNDLKPTINDINFLLRENGFKTLDMFSPNLDHYEDGVLEDIMHPYDLGWYQIDRFILENYHD